MRRSSGALLLCLLLAGCSDSSDTRPDNPGPEVPTPEPEVTDLDDTGIYRGQLVTDQGGLALVTVTLARDGTTAIAIDSDDDEMAETVLWGETSESGGELHFDGSDGRDGSSVALTFTVTGETLAGAVQLNGLAGELSTELAGSSVASAAPEGVYARQDTLGGLTELSIGTDGAVSLSSPCAGSGELSSADSAVNIYRLSVTSDCLNWEALLSVDNLEGDGELLSLSGADNLATRLYRP